MITFTDSTNHPMREVENILDSQLWHACAGGMVQMPPLNSRVFYFPQGHAEHANGNVDFRNSPRIPPLILCSISALKFMADPETDEVYVKIRLVPLKNNEADYDDDGVVHGNNGSEVLEKPTSFAKTLTQSDANNGGGFSVPRFCAETIFPPLDYSADPPVQTVLAKDVHGKVWKFRHIYRGTPRRHLLTTGWSSFVNQKKLIAGDSIVFLRTENGDLCVGIRRAKKEFGFGVGGGGEILSSWWNPTSGKFVSSYGGLSAYLREEDSNSVGGSWERGRVRVRPESVIEAATLAVNGQPFEVVYYPQASTPEFCVKASTVREAMHIQWCSGMRFKMPFETEDLSRISWFMGTISSLQFADPIRWPGSPWRVLQVTWDEPDLLQNVKCVSPWLVELVSNIPSIHLSPFSPPRKKSRLTQHPDFPLDSQLPMLSLLPNHLGPRSPFRSDTAPLSIQGARHANFGISSSNLHLNRISNDIIIMGKCKSDENVSCLLTLGNIQNLMESDNVKKPSFKLFGQTILTEKQISLSCSGDTISNVLTGNSSSDGNLERTVNFSDGSGSGSALYQQHGPPENSSYEGFQWYKDHQMEKLGLEKTGHCKVFIESEDVGRTLDLSVLGSYEELYGKLVDMFGIDKSEMLNHILYQDSTCAVKHIEDEPFGKFMQTAKRLTILMDSGSNNMGRDPTQNQFAVSGGAQELIRRA